VKIPLIEKEVEKLRGLKANKLISPFGQKMLDEYEYLIELHTKYGLREKS